MRFILYSDVLNSDLQFLKFQTMKDVSEVCLIISMIF